MKTLILLSIPILLLSKVYYSKVEPYKTYTIKSSASGEVVLSKIELEGKNIKNSKIVQLDDKIDRIELKISKQKLKVLNRMVDINRETLKSIKESLAREEAYYHRVENLSTVPISKKDNIFFNYINTKTKYLSTKEKIESLKREILNLKFKIDTLKDRILKKEIILNNRFLYKLLVHERDFVNIGTAIAKVSNLTKAKLILFIENSEIENLKSKKIFINGKETDYKISKIWKVADEKFISSYRVEIILDKNRYKFSTLLKVEFK